jgi:hypothetical protein
VVEGQTAVRCSSSLAVFSEKQKKTSM